VVAFVTTVVVVRSAVTVVVATQTFSTNQPV